MAGIFKLLTFCGIPIPGIGIFFAIFNGIWYTVDWIRVLADGFYDGNGIELEGW